MDSLIAKANTGEGRDLLAGVATADGFVGGVLITDETGAPLQSSSGLPARIVGVTEYPALSMTSTSGMTTAGAYSVSITNVGSAAGTVGGASVGAGISINLNPRAGGTVASIAYDATGTTFLIVEMTNGLSGGGGS